MNLRLSDYYSCILIAISFIILFLAFSVDQLIKVDIFYIIPKSYFFVTWEFLNNNWQGIIAISAITISLLTLQSQRKHNFISVSPNLGTSTHSHLDKIKNNTHYNISISNDGLGPAIIDSFELYYKNKIISKNDTQLFSEEIKKLLNKFFKNKKYDLTTYSYNRGGIVPQNFRHPIVQVTVNDFDLEKLENFIKEFKLIIKYKSFYNKKRTFNSDHYKP